MESRKIIILAVLVGLLGMFFSYYYLNKKEAKLLHGMQLKNVLVATKDIPPKTKLTRNLLTTQQIPERYMAPKSVVINKTTDMDRVVGKINLVPISAGQQIMTSEIVPPSEQIGLSVNVPPNMRAMIIQVNSIDLVDLLKPNDRVDVITIFSAQHAVKGKVKVVSTILQDVLVVGVSKDMGSVVEDPDSFKNKKAKDDDKSKTLALMTVSLALTPDQVQVLALAQSNGEIVLSVRANNDHEQQQNLRPIDTTIFLN